jgi:hypothetical protein
VRWLALVLLLVACGDNMSPCGYLEADDTGNATVAEATGLTVGASPTSVCGAVDPGHGSGKTLDLDRFRVTSTGGDLLVEIAGGDGTELLNKLAVRVFDTQPNPRLLAEGSLAPALADHGAFIADVPAGTYDLVVEATAPDELSGPVDYRVLISSSASARCPSRTGRADYAEAHDGASDTGNDVVSIDYGSDPWYQATAAHDAPEATGLSLVPGDAYLVTGAAATVPQADEYLDRDSYAITTDDDTNELAVRVDWAMPGADLDDYLFEAATMTPLGASNLTSTTGPELQVIAVKPHTSYLLWVGRFQETSPGPAVPYAATICATHFFDGTRADE